MSSETFLPLARRYRPRRLGDMVGQEYAVRALKNAAFQGRLHPAFLFTGTRGVGKTTLARIVAMLVNCEAPDDGEPCLDCESCRMITQGNFLDVVEMDAASHTQVENMRELLESAAFAPVRAKTKVFIIDEVHMLSKSAFNAMLKTLEEPPSHVKFILATTDPEKVPATIRSRCLCFSLLPLTVEQITARLSAVLEAEKADFDEGGVRLVARLANGSLRDALSILDQSLMHGQGRLSEEGVRSITGEMSADLLADTLLAVVEGKAAAIRALTERYFAESVDFDNALARLAAVIYRAALAKATQINEPDEEGNLAGKIAEKTSEDLLQVLYEIVVRGRQQLPLAPDPETGFEMTLLRMMRFVPRKGDAASPEFGAGGANHAEPSAPAPPATTAKRWEETQARLGAKAKSLADQCIAEFYDEKLIRLRVDKSQVSIVDKFLPAMEEELRKLHGESFQVEMVNGLDNQAADRQMEKKLRQVRESRAYRLIKQQFSEAKIVEDSIKISDGQHHG